MLGGEGGRAEDGSVQMHIGGRRDVDRLAIALGRSGVEAEELKRVVHRGNVGGGLVRGYIGTFASGIKRSLSWEFS